MCGIFTLLNNSNSNLLSQLLIKMQFEKGIGRGPENSILTDFILNAQFGFHRLAINGQNAKSNQPFIINDIILICNGEIYNYKKLYELMKILPTTDSDCEIIIHLYKKYGIDQTLQMLDGVFAFILMDYRKCYKSAKIYVVRDPYGVRPLYVMKSTDTPCIYGFASELKMLNELQSTLNKEVVSTYEISQFEPGTYSSYELIDKNAENYWNIIKQNNVYHKIGFYSDINTKPLEIYKNIQKYLYSAVEKRCITTERPIACLLSGGLDSSLITALVMEYHNLHNLLPVETYSIGLAGSEDLYHAKIVAEYLGTKHTEIVLTEEDFLNAIPEVIYAIESYDTTSVRASIGNWLLGKYIKEHSEAKVIFNGDGSDELTGGYLYMGCAPDAIEFDRECRRLLKDIHTFDVLRSDKSISSHGLEPRTPFLDRAWVQYYMSISLEKRFHNYNNYCKYQEKYLLRDAFSSDYYLNALGKPLLPDIILLRIKEAFSDGVSKQTRSLYEIIKEFTTIKFQSDILTTEMKKNVIDNDTNNVYENVAMIYPNMENIGTHLLPKTAEQFYYRLLFEKYYSGMGKILPYFWMPKYVNATDASARTLSIYSLTK